MSANYTGLDAAIMSALKQGHNQFKVICKLPYVASEAKKHEIGTRPDWRVIDARLQALRKAGKIRFRRPSKISDGGWMLIEGGGA